MKTDELSRLLEKFYKGESTVEEERDLRVFFSGDSVPEGYEAEKAVFRYYMTVLQVPEPSSEFEARIMAGIDESEKNSIALKFRRLILPVISSAAAILLLAGSYFFFVHSSEPRDTFSDPKLAYAETMKILMDISSQMNHGAVALEPVTRINDLTAQSFASISKSTKIVEKNLRNLQSFQRAIEITNKSLEKSTNKK
jgi:hypothetical protein